MSSTYFERNNTKTNKPTTRTFHLHVGHKPRCKLLASVALVSMENFGNVEVVLLLPGGLRFATWKLQLTPTFLHAHSFSHYQYVKQRRIQVHIVSKFWKKILEVRNRNWYHVIIIINHIYIYILYTFVYVVSCIFVSRAAEAHRCRYPRAWRVAPERDPPNPSELVASKKKSRKKHVGSEFRLW